MQAPGKQTHSGQPCNTCGGVGGVGFQELIAICTRCRTAREHVYCMRSHLYVVPEGWVCESCLSSDLVLSEASGMEDVVGTALDSSNIVCQDNTHTAGPSSLNRAYSKRQKPVETGKVKFLPTEEVLKLSSSTPKKVTSVRSNSGSKPCPSMASSRTTQVGCTAATPKFPTLSVNATHCLGPSGLVKPPRHGSVCSRTDQEALQAPKNIKEPKAAVTFRKEYCRNEQSVNSLLAKVNETYRTNAEKATNKASCLALSKKRLPITEKREKRALALASEELVCAKPLMDALAPAKKLESSHMNIEKAIKKARTHSPSRRSSPVASSALEVFSGREPMDLPIAKEHETFTMKTEDIMNKASCPSSPPMHTSTTVISDGNFRGVAECNNSDVEERDLHSVLPKFKLYHDYLPALHATWGGGFVFTAVPFKFYGWFQAQPPCTINRKAFEFSKRMPSALQVMFVPRCQVWADLFQNSCPHLSDVALYFFPADNIERSKENMSCLFELMEVHDSMMRSCIDGVELLIFTSNQLHLGSQKFFWAVFHPVKNNHTFDKIDKERSPPIDPLEFGTNDNMVMDSSEEVCMEIDMVGGENVGRVDVAISRDALS
ncbi:uncharacterized protein LOC121237263 isoform X1 [Juglans microcarpa x Juglans regia]|uniref:uncharacterized protein LOC121237263 isoform X1 n=2 Tax=Juglans microcarpa x Juglans regia TaxID=2249226 RepID=UPI001B7DAC7D|nr:uncharacterized protein LOC121237263 isoform X1 [Juglans microcarpa x Juglans regia]